MTVGKFFSSCPTSLVLSFSRSKKTINNTWTQHMDRTSLWDGRVRDWLTHVELVILLHSFSWFAVSLVIAIVFAVPFVGHLEVWPAYGWIYLLIILILYGIILWTIHNTAAIKTVALDAILLFLVLLGHIYMAATLLAYVVMEPLGLVPAAAQREFYYSIHVILLVVHLFRLIHDFTGLRMLLDVSKEVRERLKSRSRQRPLEQINGDDAEQEMMDLTQ